MFRTKTSVARWELHGDNIPPPSPSLKPHTHCFSPHPHPIPLVFSKHAISYRWRTQKYLPFNCDYYYIIKLSKNVHKYIMFNRRNISLCDIGTAGSAKQEWRRSKSYNFEWQYWDSVSFEMTQIYAVLIPVVIPDCLFHPHGISGTASFVPVPMALLQIVPTFPAFSAVFLLFPSPCSCLVMR